MICRKHHVSDDSTRNTRFWVDDLSKLEVPEGKAAIPCLERLVDDIYTLFDPSRKAARRNEESDRAEHSVNDVTCNDLLDLSRGNSIRSTDQ
jgi:hypothetical protein